MNRKIPPEAFDFYARLGVGRSYEEVAKHFGVARSSVAARAARDRWQERLEELERKAKEELEQRTLADLVAMRDRHAKLGRLMQSQGANSLIKAPVLKPADALRAITNGIDEELRAVVKPEPKGPKVEDDKAPKVLAREIRDAIRAAQGTIPPPPGA